jgi:hypothetical protein
MHGSMPSQKVLRRSEVQRRSMSISSLQTSGAAALISRQMPRSGTRGGGGS